VGTAPSVSTSYTLPAGPVTFNTPGVYSLKWTGEVLLKGIQTLNTGTLQIAAGASGCQLAVSVPGAGVNAGQLPGVGGAVGSVLPPVTVPGVQVPVPSAPVGGNPTPGNPNPNPGTSKPGTSNPGPGLNYHRPGSTVADRTVPHGYGGGNGAANQYVPPGLGNSIVAQGTTAVSGSNTTSPSKAAAAPGGSAPKTVDVASSKGRSALDALPTLMVVLAVIALSGATAFYARTFLLHKPVRTRVSAT
jgi:hypothetical protein